jgi:hypothetical protein
MARFTFYVREYGEYTTSTRVVDNETGTEHWLDAYADRTSEMYGAQTVLTMLGIPYDTVVERDDNDDA